MVRDALLSRRSVLKPRTLLTYLPPSFGVDLTLITLGQDNRSSAGRENNIKYGDTYYLPLVLPIDCSPASEAVLTQYTNPYSSPPPRQPSPCALALK